MENGNISELQRAAGLILQSICAVLNISREDFCAVLAKFLKGGKEDKKEKAGREATALTYFQKLPKKYLLREDGFALFKMVLENAVQSFSCGVDCSIDGQAVSKSWSEHGNEIMRQFDLLHEKAVGIEREATLTKNRQKIKYLLSD